MPYSKNPHKYPPELLQLLSALQHVAGGRVEIGCRDRSEAFSKRTMIQSFFRAVEHYSGDLNKALGNIRGKASTAADRKDRAAKDLADEYEIAREMAGQWEGKAYIAQQWMVKVDGTKVIVERRKLDGAFGDSLKAFLDQGAGAAPGTGESPEDQMTLIRQASLRLQQELGQG